MAVGVKCGFLLVSFVAINFIEAVSFAAESPDCQGFKWSRYYKGMDIILVVEPESIAKRLSDADEQYSVIVKQVIKGEFSKRNLLVNTNSARIGFLERLKMGVGKMYLLPLTKSIDISRPLSLHMRLLELNSMPQLESIKQVMKYEWPPEITKICEAKLKSSSKLKRETADIPDFETDLSKLKKAEFNALIYKYSEFLNSKDYASARRVLDSEMRPWVAKNVKQQAKKDWMETDKNDLMEMLDFQEKVLNAREKFVRGKTNSQANLSNRPAQSKMKMDNAEEPNLIRGKYHFIGPGEISAIGKPSLPLKTHEDAFQYGFGVIKEAGLLNTFIQEHLTNPKVEFDYWQVLSQHFVTNKVRRWLVEVAPFKNGEKESEFLCKARFLENGKPDSTVSGQRPLGCGRRGVW